MSWAEGAPVAARSVPVRLALRGLVSVGHRCYEGCSTERAFQAAYFVATPMESSCAMTSGASLSLATLRFSRRCSTDDVPGISSMLGDRWSSHASATCMGVASSDAATSLSSDDCSGENPPSGK